MEKQELRGLIAEHGSLRKIAAATDKSYSTIKYWVNKHKLSTKAPKAKHRCSNPECRETDESKFYKRGNRLQAYCKACFNAHQSRRWIENKKKAIAHKGSRCKNCKLKSPHYSIYDFHHRQGEGKDLDWSQLKKRSWDKIVEEIEKCDLLCANCHRIVHEGDFNHNYHGSMV